MHRSRSNLSLVLNHRLHMHSIVPPFCFSYQVFKGMDIGSDKVSPEVRSAVPHYLLDVQDFRTWLGYSAGQFADDAEAIIPVSKSTQSTVTLGSSSGNSFQWVLKENVLYISHHVKRNI